MKRAGFALVIVLLLTMPAVSAVNIMTAVSVAPLTLTSSEITTASRLQAKVVFNGQDVRQWSSSMDVFMSGIPTGPAVEGLYVRVYPRPLPGAEKMFATRAETLPPVVDLNSPLLEELTREGEGMVGAGAGGSYFYDFKPNLFPGPGAVRFYALIKNGKRWELRIVWFIGLVHKSDATKLLNVFEYTTAPWSGTSVPDPGYLRVIMNRAGAGGRGGEYEDLAMENWEKTQAIKKAETPTPPKAETPTPTPEKTENRIIAPSRQVNSGSFKTVRKPVIFIGTYDRMDLDISRPDGSIDKLTVYPGETQLDLQCGRNIFEMKVYYPSGRVRAKNPIEYVVDLTERSITFRDGGE